MAQGGPDPVAVEGVERSWQDPAPNGRTGADLDGEEGARRASSIEPSMAVNWQVPGAIVDVVEGSSNLLLDGKETYAGAVSMQQSSALSCYPFMNPAFFSFQSRSTSGFAKAMTLQDMVMQASNGVLDSGAVNQFEFCSAVKTACMGSNVISVDNSEGELALPSDSEQLDCTIVELQQVSSLEDCNIHLGESSMGAGMGSDNDAEPTAVEDNGHISEDGGIESIVLDCGGGVKPWPKGKRFPSKAPDAMPPRLMGAIERALRNSATRTTKYIFEPKVGMTFDCTNEAREFYNIYSWEVGFGIKLGDKFGKTMQEFQCQCQGSDSRVQYKTKKKNCKALLRLHRTDDFRWYVRYHRSEHNHPLAESYAEKLCWNSHGWIDQYSMDMIRYLRDNNVTLTKVNQIMGTMIGPTGEAPWTKNSISNLCKRIAKEQKADDVRKTLEVFKGLKKQDPGFQCCFDYDNKNKIKTMMWCSGKSRSQYSCFGDVVTFDTTYCTNIYKMPFGIFVGVNNHFQSIIFAGVLMTDETADSFEWVFNQFVELMGGKRPQTILTDQCLAMDIAIGRCWKGTAHLWCRWHVLRTAQAELGPIFTFGTNFYNDFHKIINDMLTIDEFENAWAQLLVTYKLQNDEFMQRTYNKRKRWAKPYNKGVYCAGMTSTQRSESANFMLKTHVPRNSSMNKFVMNYNNLLLARYKVEQEAEHLTKQDVFVHERAWPVEIHALQVYTNAANMLFRKQVDKSTRYHVRTTSNPLVFLVVLDKAKQKERYARVEFTVQMEEGGGFFECHCGHYSHIGILCCHIIRVMFQLGITRIPDRHIMNRWTRVARDSIPDDINFYRVDIAAVPTPTLTYRNRLLTANASRMVTEGDYDAETFEIATKHMNRAFMEIADYRKLKSTLEEGRIHIQNDEIDSEYGNGTDTDAETRGNSYGAAGASAGLSDSELLSLRAPDVKVVRGRPRINRYRPRADIIKEKMQKKARQLKKKKKTGKKCTSCGLDDHKSSECFTKGVVMASNEMLD